MSQRIDREMHLGSLAFLGAIISGAPTTLRRGLQRATVQDHRAGCVVAIVGQTEQQTQIFSHRFKTTRAHPAAGLLIHGVPRRQIVRHQPPRTARARQPAQAIEEFAQRVLALWRVFLHQRQAGNADEPFFLTHVAGISFSPARHPKRTAQLYLQCTDFFSGKMKYRL